MKKLLKALCGVIDGLFEKYDYLSAAARVFYAVAVSVLVSLLSLIVRSIPNEILPSKMTDVIALLMILFTSAASGFLLAGILGNKFAAKVIVLLFWLMLAVMFVTGFVGILLGRTLIHPVLATLMIC